MTEYVKITFRQAGRDTARTAWARKTGRRGRLRQYEVVRRDGCPKATPEILIASEADILAERPARMNLKYAELETDEVTR